MTPLVFGLLAGLASAVALTVAYHRLRGVPALVALMCTIFFALLPRLYYGLGAYRNTSADFEYVLGWMLVVSVGFTLGYRYFGRFFKESK